MATATITAGMVVEVITTDGGTDGIGDGGIKKQWIWNTVLDGARSCRAGGAKFLVNVKGEASD